MWPAGCWGSSPRRLYLFSPLPLPSPWSVLFPAAIPGAALGPQAEGGGTPVPDGTAKGSGSRACASWQPPAAQAPTDRTDSLLGVGLSPLVTETSPEAAPVLAPATTSTEWDMDLFKMLSTLDPDVHRLGAPARRSSLGTDRRWSPSDAPGPGVDPHATGGGRQVPPRRSAPAATVSHSRSSSARPNSWRHTARPGRYREPNLETGPGRSTSLFLNRPVAGRRCRTGALGAVAGTADANACVRGAGSCACLLRTGCLSLFSAARLSLPWFVRVPAPIPRGAADRRSWTVLMQARRTTEATDQFPTAPAAVRCDPRGSPLCGSGRASSSASGACCPSRASAQRRRETEPYRHPLPDLTESSARSKRAVPNGPIRPTAQRLPSPRRRGHPPLRQSTGTEDGPRVNPALT